MAHTHSGEGFYCLNYDLHLPPIFQLAMKKKKKKKVTPFYSWTGSANQTHIVSSLFVLLRVTQRVQQIDHPPKRKFGLFFSFFMIDLSVDLFVFEFMRPAEQQVALRLDFVFKTEFV